MIRKLLISLTILAANPLLAQPSAERMRTLENRQADNRTVVGSGNPLLSAGAEAIRFGRFDDGIRLTLLGLERELMSSTTRAAALSNLCAAHAGKNQPNEAIVYCTESISVHATNWRAFSNRSYAYWLKGMYENAEEDLEAAVAINPNSREVFVIRGMLNEAGLRPRIIMEDHQ